MEESCLVQEQERKGRVVRWQHVLHGLTGAIGPPAQRHVEEAVGIGIGSVPRGDDILNVKERKRRVRVVLRRLVHPGQSGHPGQLALNLVVAERGQR